MRNAGPRHQERAAAIDLVHQIVALGVGLQGRREADGAGVVDTDIDAAKFVDRPGYRRFNLLLETNVALERQRPAAGVAYLFGRGVNRSRQLWVWRCGLGGDGNVGAVACGTQRDRQPDATRGAGDEERFTR